jgi:hypothetical protein
MKKFTSRFLPLCLAAGFFLHASLNNATAQRRSSDTITRSVGLGAYMQNSHLHIIVPIWAGPKLAIVPMVRVKNTENVGTDLGLGATIRIYTKIARVSPYFGVRGNADVVLPTGGGSATNFEGGILYGGEFFLNNQFSFGIEAHVIVFVPEVGPRMINTATMFLANIYF